MFVFFEKHFQGLKMLFCSQQRWTSTKARKN